MFLGSIGAIMQWVQFGAQVFKAGKPAYDAVMSAAADHGVQVDTEHLDAVIVDSARRKAEADAQSTVTE